MQLQSSATDDDGGCARAGVPWLWWGMHQRRGRRPCRDEEEVPGCTDVDACNTMVGATDDDGLSARTYYDCAGACLNDADDDDVCDELEVSGCTVRWVQLQPSGDRRRRQLRDSAGVP